MKTNRVQPSRLIKESGAFLSEGILSYVEYAPRLLIVLPSRQFFPCDECRYVIYWIWFICNFLSKISKCHKCFCEILVRYLLGIVCRLSPRINLSSTFLLTIKFNIIYDWNKSFCSGRNTLWNIWNRVARLWSCNILMWLTVSLILSRLARRWRRWRLQVWSQNEV